MSNNKIDLPVLCLIKRDTLSNWYDYNPKLKKHELICCLNESRDAVLGYKLGDGRHHFKKTPWIYNLSELNYFVVYNHDTAIAAVVLDGRTSNSYLDHTTNEKETKIYDCMRSD